MLSAFNFRRDIFSLYHHKKMLLIPNRYMGQNPEVQNVQKLFEQIHSRCSHQGVLNREALFVSQEDSQH